MNTQPTGVLHSWDDAAHTIEQPALAEIGKIKMGKKNERGLPVSLDYFRATGKYEQLFHAAFGAEPDKIPIMFLSSDRRRVCNVRHEIRLKGDVYAFGDGKRFEVWDPAANRGMGAMRPREIKSKADLETFRDEMRQTCNSEWYIVLTLRFLILHPSFPYGEWSLVTKGDASTIKNIVGSFNTILNHLKTVQMIVWDLGVIMHTSDRPNKSKYPVATLTARMNSNEADYLREHGDQIRAEIGMTPLNTLSINKAIARLELPPMSNQVALDRSIADKPFDDLDHIDTFAEDVEPIENHPSGHAPGSLAALRFDVGKAADKKSVEVIRDLWNSAPNHHINSALVPWILERLKIVWAICGPQFQSKPDRAKYNALVKSIRKKIESDHKTALDENGN